MRQKIYHWLISKSFTKARNESIFKFISCLYSSLLVVKSSDRLESFAWLQGSIILKKLSPEKFLV